jgi:nitroimidazol reductase NimA-like FMN-containing flavoprotein (pyridoxamine 5'-phosphate oxidase superfamily)
MAEEPQGDERVRVRRRDRQVTDDAWIAELLRRESTGTLATVAGGQPFVNSNLFVYLPEDDAIYLHTARTGRTRQNVEGDERVCFTVFRLGRLLPADTALEMSAEYASVVVFGRAAIVEDEAEAKRALNALLKKYFPHLEAGRDYRAIQPDELARTTVYRVAIESWSGKRKEVAADFPGAITYQG